MVLINTKTTKNSNISDDILFHNAGDILNLFYSQVHTSILRPSYLDCFLESSKGIFGTNLTKIESNSEKVGEYYSKTYSWNRSYGTKYFGPTSQTWIIWFNSTGCSSSNSWGEGSETLSTCKSPIHQGIATLINCLHGFLIVSNMEVIPTCVEAPGIHNLQCTLA